MTLSSMMSGLRSHFEKTLTCVSDKSGSASMAMCCMLQTPITARTTTMTRTRPRLTAHQRMILSIKSESRRQKAEVLSPSPPFIDERHKNRDQLVCFVFNSFGFLRSEEIRAFNDLQPIQRLFEFHEATVHLRDVLGFRPGTESFAKMSTG